MRPCLLLAAPALASLVACGPALELDEDHDGATTATDCDDADPLVYPGAPDHPADGVDADCDGEDPPFAFVGDWSVTSVYADYGGYAVFVPGTATGGLTVSEDLDAALSIQVDLDPALAGRQIPLPLDMTGWASPVDGDAPGLSQLYLSGFLSLLDEDLAVDWACDADTASEADDADAPPSMDCEGALKALDTSLLLLATFEAG